MKLPRLLYCTVVGPEEYDIKAQTIQTIKTANLEFGKPSNDSPYLPFDIGKYVGLYEAWEEGRARLQRAEALEKDLRNRRSNDGQWRDEVALSFANELLAALTLPPKAPKEKP